MLHLESVVYSPSLYLYFWDLYLDLESLLQLICFVEYSFVDHVMLRVLYLSHLWLVFMAGICQYKLLCDKARSITLIILNTIFNLVFNYVLLSFRDEI